MPPNTNPTDLPVALRADPKFWDGLARQANGCWLWTGSHDPKGYGRLSRKAVSPAPMLTHRYAWLLAFGDPGTQWVLHRCDVPPCCNPAHLFLGTAADNVHDMWSKNRQSAPPPHNMPEACPNGHPAIPANRVLNGRGPDGRPRTRCLTCKREKARVPWPPKRKGPPRKPPIV